MDDAADRLRRIVSVIERRMPKSRTNTGIRLIYEIASGRDPEGEDYTKPKPQRKVRPPIIVTSTYLRKRFGIKA